MTRAELETLKAIRTYFLGDENTATPDYWNSEAHLSLYDRFFGARIAWKWQAVLEECAVRGLTPQNSPLLADWGCGTGRASRAVLKHFGPKAFSGVAIWDRSPLSLEFAARALQSETGQIAMKEKTPAGRYWFLVSHVLGELNESATAELIKLASHAEVVLWVEPGTHRASRALGKARDALREKLHVIAPCPHVLPCGMFRAENESHWCHHFAKSDSAAFHSAEWSEFSRELGIDLRSLPYSYLVLAKNELARASHRMIGRPRMHKADADVLLCQADSNIADKRLLKRDDPELFKHLKHGGSY